MRNCRHNDRHGRASDRRLERITGSKRRARSAKEKAAIVAEAFAPGASVSKIRRDHGLNRGLLFTWRRQDPGRRLRLPGHHERGMPASPHAPGRSLLATPRRNLPALDLAIREAGRRQALQPAPG